MPLNSIYSGATSWRPRRWSRSLLLVHYQECAENNQTAKEQKGYEYGNGFKEPGAFEELPGMFFFGLHHNLEFFLDGYSGCILIPEGEYPPISIYISELAWKFFEVFGKCKFETRVRPEWGTFYGPYPGKPMITRDTLDTLPEFRPEDVF